MSQHLPVLRFQEHYVYRLWGGRQLQDMYGKNLPPEQAIGEAWLISDHASHESVVADGPLAGTTLRQLLERDAGAALGTGARLTPHGRFPLLLKLLDANDDLSVQVHPDDDTASRLGEPDVGKTEMWHVLRAEPGSRLIGGIRAGNRGEFMEAARNGSVETLLEQFEVGEGESVMVPAGTVHAIGKGIVLAEIQQNSDITYRLYDYGRVQDNGTPRELHLEKSEQAIHWSASPASVATPLTCPRGGVATEILAACRYFAAERVLVDGVFERQTRNYSFHILLCVSGTIGVRAGGGELPMSAGQALLVPGAMSDFSVVGVGAILDYYVPDLALDVAKPLLNAGYPKEAIGLLGGPNPDNDLFRSMGMEYN